MSTPAKRVKWDLVRDRFARLSPVRWRDEATPTSEERERDHALTWKEAQRPHRMVTDPDQVRYLMETVSVIGWRYTRLVAVATQVIHPRGSLGEVPLRPDGWAAPLPRQEFPLQTPEGLTLDPRHTTPEAFFLTLIEVLNRLGTGVGTPAYVAADWLLEDQDRALMAWPTPQDLVTFERDLLSFLSAKAARAGRNVVLRYLTQQLGMVRDEATGVMAMALAPFRDVGRVDPDVERGLAIVRFEDLANRARKAFDLKNEVAALKAHAAVVGLTRETPGDRKGDEQADLIDAIHRVVQEDGPPGPPELTTEVTSTPEEDE